MKEEGGWMCFDLVVCCDGREGAGLVADLMLGG